MADRPPGTSLRWPIGHLRSGMSITIEVKIHIDRSACDCEYPKQRFRNGSGHRETCPVHAEWVKSRQKSDPTPDTQPSRGLWSR